MPQLCTGSVKEVLSHTLSDVVVAGAGGSFACFPSDRAKLFAVPSSFSLCSSAFINGVLLGGGTCDASFVIHGLRFKFLATAARPVIQCVAGTPAVDACLGVDPFSMSIVLLLAQLLVEQIRISFEVQERAQICQFGSRFPGGGGLWADLAAASNTLGSVAATPCDGTQSIPVASTGAQSACAVPALYAVVQNGFPHHDNVYTLDQAIGVGNGQSVGAVVEFDTITKADGSCCSVLDLLACQGNSGATCVSQTATPACDFSGLLVKADFQVDGLLCRAVC
jgi:hypothetical protein